MGERMPDSPFEQLPSSGNVSFEQVYPLIQRNFEAAQTLANVQSVMDNFTALAFQVTKNEANVKIAHNLGFVPKDVIITRLLAPSTAKLYVNHGLSDSDNLNITVSGLADGELLDCRLLVGTFSLGDPTPESLSQSAQQVFRSGL